MFEYVNFLVSQLHMGINVIGELVGLKMQLIAQATEEAYVMVNYIDSILHLFS